MLDELRDYLLEPPTAVAEGIAVALLALLDDEARRPVVVLATLWPRFWDLLTAHRRFERLLQDADIAVPDTFGDADRASALANGDPGLVEAVTRADDGAVIQYLGGVPQLLDRYRIRRAAHRGGRRLPVETGAGQGHARPRVGRPSLTRLGDGDTSLLHPRGEDLRLADYLEQHGRRTRDRELVPAELWSACLEHAASPTDLRRLAEAAHERMLYSWARPMYEQAFRRGDAEALTGLVAVLAAQEDVSAVADLAARTGAGQVHLVLARLHVELGDLRSAERSWRAAVTAGCPRPDHALLQVLTVRAPEQALSYCRACADGGDQEARR